MVDYINELREGCLEAYTGIVQGLKGDNEKQMNRKISGVYVLSICCGNGQQFST